MVKLLPRSEQMRAGSIRSMALFSGAIVGSGVMLVLQGLWGWEAPFFLMLAGLLVGLLLICLLNEDKHSTVAAGSILPHQPLIDFSGFFRQPEDPALDSVADDEFPVCRCRLAIYETPVAGLWR